LLNSMPPFLAGGMMIQEVTTDNFTAADIPSRFEAGTQSVADAVGLRAAIEWFSQYDWEAKEEAEKKLIRAAYDQLKKIDGLTILGFNAAENVSGCISFVIKSIHPHDLTELLGQEGICLRAGHHCAQPLHTRLGINASTRLSFGIYNTEEEIEMCIQAIKEIQTRFA